MKPFKFLFAAIIFLMMTSNMQSQNKSLIVYFTSTGNTEVIAKDIKEITGADIFRIEPVNAYPKEYKALINKAKDEINRGYHPKLKATVKNFNAYHTIYVGSPDWWGTIAPPVATFLASNNFNGKVIVPFMTSGGSGFGHSLSDIKKLCPHAKILKGYTCLGTQVREAKREVMEWIKGLKK